MAPNSESRAEFLLLAALGLALPFADFPLFVWNGFGLDCAHVVAGILVLAVAARLRLPRQRAGWPAGILFAAGLLVTPLLAYAFRRLPGFSVSAFWRTYAHFAFWLAVSGAIALCAVGQRRLSLLLAALAGEGLLLGLYGVWQTVAYARGWPTGVAALNQFAHQKLRGDAGYNVWRATATFEEPKWLAIHLSFSAVYAYALAVRARARGRSIRAAGWLLVVLSIAACAIFTVSIGGIATMALLLAVMAVHFIGSLRSRRTLALVSSACLAAAVGAWIWIAPGARLLRDRVDAAMESLPGRSDFSAPYTSAWRYERNARYAIRIFTEAPLFGIGVGQFAPVGKVRGEQLGFSPDDTSHPWVGWVAWLAEMGLAGAALLAALLAAILLRSSRVPLQLRNPYTALTWMLVLAVVAKECHSGFYVTFWTWYPLGIAGLSARVAGDWQVSQYSGA